MTPTRPSRDVKANRPARYRTGTKQPRNIYRTGGPPGDNFIAVMFTDELGVAAVTALNAYHAAGAVDVAEGLDGPYDADGHTIYHTDGVAYHQIGCAFDQADAALVASALTWVAATASRGDTA